MAEQVTILPITQSFQFQSYSDKDDALIQSVLLNKQFGNISDYIEGHIYDPNDTLLNSNLNISSYQLINPDSSSLSSMIEFDPVNDVKNQGYPKGQFNITYNLLTKIFSTDENIRFFIQEISSDRTELKIISNNLGNDQIESDFNIFVANSNQAYYPDFYLNFGNNELAIAVNVLLSKEDKFALFIKLYEPLPENFGLKDSFWLVNKISDPISYNIDIELQDVNQSNIPFLRGPNFNISLTNQISKPTDYFTYNQLFQTVQTSSYQQLKSILQDKSFDINVDYSDYNNFVHFSSAKERLLNFTYKIKLIESFNRDINKLSSFGNPLNYQVSASIATLQFQANELIEKFDDYEYYLYFNTSSATASAVWPKQTITKPYVLYSSTSSQALTWLGSDVEGTQYYGGQTLSASFYDKSNVDYIVNTIPAFIREDPSNDAYSIFLSMVGQHFDNIWIYIKSIQDVYNANNDLYKGISKDLLSTALNSLGIKLYTNTNTSGDLFYSLLGITPSGSLLPDTGSEVIRTYVTASNQTIPNEDVTNEIYKRLYHNLPYLLKTKGTSRGLRALINCFGIPDTILKINEYGGGVKDQNTIERYYNKFSYAFDTQGTSSVNIPWLPSNYQFISSGTGSAVPDSIEFAFKTPGIPSASNYSQSLFQVGSGSTTQFGIQLIFTSASNSGSFENYGDLRFVLSGAPGYLKSNPVHLPFFDGGWWNVLLFRETSSLTNPTSSNTYWIVAKNSPYIGVDGVSVGYQGSSSLFISGALSASYNNSWINYNSGAYYAYLGGTGSNGTLATGNLVFTGSFQEFRYWINPLSQSALDSHTRNRSSFVGNNLSSSLGEMIFRLPLGNDLQTATSSNSSLISVHPSVSGSQIITGSFISGSTIISNARILNFNNNFVTNTSYQLFNPPNTGASRVVTDKVRIINQQFISGSTLSPLASIAFISPTGSLTQDLHFVDVTISPQDQINLDIINNFGYWNIDEFIGNPREASERSYAGLRDLRNKYFAKYIRSYSLTDLIRLIKYFDNSLFKMIKDYVPARTNLSTGVMIQSHLLERNKIQRFQPEIIQPYYSGSIRICKISGSNAPSTNYTSSHTSSISSVSGTINFIRNDGREWITGQFGGSVTIAHTQGSGNIIYELNKLGSGSLSPILVPLKSIASVNLSYPSSFRMKVDYNSNSLVAVNSNLISSGTAERATIPDSNYTLLRHTRARYLGSKTTSATYNVYTAGDTSYGKTAAIDKNSIKFAYFSQVVLSGSTFPGRSNAYIKYLIDENSNVTELTTQNKNLFDVQNIFKGGGYGDISLFDNLVPDNQKQLDGLKLIYAGGFKYFPVLYNPLGAISLNYNLTSSISVTTQGSGETGLLAASGSGSRINFSGYTGYGTPGNNNNYYIYQPVLVAKRIGDLLTTYLSTKIYVYWTGSIHMGVTASGGQTFNSFVVPSPYASSSTFGKFNVSGTITFPAGTTALSASIDSLTGVGGAIVGLFNLQTNTNGGTLMPDNGQSTVNFRQAGGSIGAFSITQGATSNITTVTYTVVDTPSSGGFFLRDIGTFSAITASSVMSQYYQQFIQGDSVGDYEQIQNTFSIGVGDLILFYDTGSNSFPRNNEREVISATIVPLSILGNRLVIQLNGTIPATSCADFQYPSGSNADSAQIINKFIILRKQADETNIVLDFQKQSGDTSPGIIVPFLTSGSLKAKAGNIVKELTDKKIIST